MVALSANDRGWIACRPTDPWPMQQKATNLYASEMSERYPDNSLTVGRLRGRGPSKKE